MPWPPREPEPLEVQRRRLEEQERLLAAQRLRLEEELKKSIEPVSPEESVPPEPPLWRLEEGRPRRVAEPTPARKRNLARQRQRDMILFFILIFVLVVVLGICIYLACVRNVGVNSGA